MKRVLTLFAIICALLGAVSAYAHSYKLGPIEVGHTWTTVTPAGVTEAAVYFPLLNTGAEADKLIGASSPWAAKVEIRQASANAKDKAQTLNAIELRPNAPVPLSQSGIYLLAVGLKKPLADKDRMPLTLKFEKAGSIGVEAMVGAPH